MFDTFLSFHHLPSHELMDHLSPYSLTPFNLPIHDYKAHRDRILRNVRLIPVGEIEWKLFLPSRLIDKGLSRSTFPWTRIFFSGQLTWKLPTYEFSHELCLIRKWCLTHVPIRKLSLARYLLSSSRISILSVFYSQLRFPLDWTNFLLRAEDEGKNPSAGNKKIEKGEWNLINLMLPFTTRRRRSCPIW